MHRMIRMKMPGVNVRKGDRLEAPESGFHMIEICQEPFSSPSGALWRQIAEG